MFDTALEKILENTYTKQDLYARLGVVKECLEHVLFTASDDQTNRTYLCVEFARQIGRPDMARYIEEWGGEVLDIFTAKDLYSQIEELKAHADSLPEIILYVPVLLENKEVVEFGGWCREQFDSRVIIDLIIDPKALGGCGFVWQGKYHDYSLNYFLEKNKDEVKEIIRGYEQK